MLAGASTRALRKSLEEIPDDLGAIDIVILRAQQPVHHARKARIGKTAGHAVAAIIDAVEHDIASGRATRRDPRHRGLVGLVAVLEIGDASVLCFAAIGAPPELERPFGRPEAVDRKAAGAASALIGN